MSQKRIRRKFDKEFKQEAVKIVQKRNEYVNTIAKELVLFQKILDVGL